MNRHLRALTFDNLSLDNHKQSLPFVQKILNANYSDRLKISSSQMLFRNMLDLDRGIFLKHPERLMYKSVSGHMSKLLSMQDNLLKTGPMKVLEGRDSRYKLLDLITLKEKEFHVSDMKPFVYEAALADPLNVARRGNMEYFIDKILEHKGNL